MQGYSDGSPFFSGYPVEDYSEQQLIKLLVEIIELFKIKDTSERFHVPFGLLTSRANIFAFVCLDDHPVLGQCLHLIRAIQIKQILLSYLLDRKKPVFGSLKDNSASNTGAGYRINIYKGYPLLGVESIIKSTPFPIDDLIDKRRGTDQSEKLVGKVLKELRFPHRPASKAEQLAGMDYIGKDSRPDSEWRMVAGSDDLRIEVKSRDRDKRYDELFFQITETNNEHRTR